MKAKVLEKTKYSAVQENWLTTVRELKVETKMKTKTGGNEKERSEKKKTVFITDSWSS